MGIEEQEFISLLADKRHKELIGVMTKILERMDKISLTEDFEKVLQTLSEKPAQDIPGAISAISKVLVKKLDELKKTYQAPKAQKSEWTFKVHYDSDEKITEVVAQGK